MFISLKIVERGRKTPICTDPWPAVPFFCGIFSWIHRTASEVRESPEQGILTARAELGYWSEIKGTACVGCGTVYIFSEIKTNPTKIKTMFNLPAQISNSASFISSKGGFYLISLWLSKHWVSALSQLQQLLCIWGRVGDVSAGRVPPTTNSCHRMSWAIRWRCTSYALHSIFRWMNVAIVELYLTGISTCSFKTSALYKYICINMDI